METVVQTCLKNDPSMEKEFNYDCNNFLSIDQQNSKFISMLAFGNRKKCLEPLSDHVYTLHCLWNAKKLYRGSSLSTSLLPPGKKVVPKVNVQNSIKRKKNVTRRKNYFTQSQPTFSSNIYSIHKSICLPYLRCVNLPDNYLLPSFYTQKAYTKYISINRISKIVPNLSCGSCLLKIKRLKKNDNQSLASFHYNILSSKFGSLIKKETKSSDFHFKKFSRPEVKKVWNKKRLKTFSSRKLEEKKMINHLQSLLPATYQLDSNSPDVILKNSAEYIKELEEELKYSIEECLPISSIDRAISINGSLLTLDVGPVLENISEKFSDQWTDDNSFKSLFPNLSFNSNINKESTSASGKLISFEELANSFTPSTFDIQFGSSEHLNEKTRNHGDDRERGEDLDLSTNYFIDDILMKTFNRVSYNFDPCLLDFYDEVSSDTNIKDDYIYDDVNLNSSVIPTGDFSRQLFSMADESIHTSISCT